MIARNLSTFDKVFVSSADGKITVTRRRGINRALDLSETIDFIIGFEIEIGLEAYLHESFPKANFIKSESGLSRRLYESDIAIIAGGFIKYELAAVGTPGIIVSIVEHQHELSVMFSAKKTAEYIGILSELTVEQIRRSVAELSSNSSLRTEMSFAGKRLVDCLALERLTPVLIT